MCRDCEIFPLSIPKEIVLLLESKRNIKASLVMLKVGSKKGTIPYHTLTNLRPFMVYDADARESIPYLPMLRKLYLGSVSFPR